MQVNNISNAGKGPSHRFGRVEDMVNFEGRGCVRPGAGSVRRFGWSGGFSPEVPSGGFVRRSVK